LAFDIFELTKAFPENEKYGLVDQIRRSSRGTAAIIAEAYRKRTYPKSFVSKLVEADGEATETQVWLDFAERCGYLSKRKHEELIQRSEEIGRMLGGMLKHPEKFCGTN